MTKKTNNIERINTIWRKMDSIKPYPDNPRTLTKKSFERLKKSFIENPLLINGKPLLLSDRTGELVILAGNSRYAVALALGYVELPTILFSGLSEEKEREYLIRDNVNDGDWDWEALANWDINEALEAFGVKIKDAPKERDISHKLTLKFTAMEFEQVSQQLCDLSETMGCGSIEETIIKILDTICNPTQN